MTIIFHDTGTVEQKLNDILNLIDVESYERHRIEAFFDEIKTAFEVADGMEEDDDA